MSFCYLQTQFHCSVATVLDPRRKNFLKGSHEAAQSFKTIRNKNTSEGLFLSWKIYFITVLMKYDSYVIPSLTQSAHWNGFSTMQPLSCVTVATYCRAFSIPQQETLHPELSPYNLHAVPSPEQPLIYCLSPYFCLF